MNKKRQICWADFATGFFAGVALALLIALFTVPTQIKAIIQDNNGSSSTTSNDGESKAEAGELRQYITTQKEWLVTTEDGTTLNFYTPEGWYSLADQYADGLTEYYGVELTDIGVACVGNNSDQYQATAIINSRPLSNTADTLKKIYGDEYDESKMLYSSTYNYMKDGTEPDESETIEELDSITANGHTYRVFVHGYDTEYYTNEEQTETTTVHTDEVLAYSDTEDPVEIICYMSEFDKDELISKLKEFLGAE